MLISCLGAPHDGKPRRLPQTVLNPDRLVLPLMVQIFMPVYGHITEWLFRLYLLFVMRRKGFLPIDVTGFLNADLVPQFVGLDGSACSAGGCTELRIHLPHPCSFHHDTKADLLHPTFLIAPYPLGVGALLSNPPLSTLSNLSSILERKPL
jgi:hypothetical protein